MDKIFTRGGIVVTEPPVQSLREKLMLAASAGILACVAPSGFYGIRAHAQAVPVECDDPLASDVDNNADGNADDGHCTANDGSSDNNTSRSTCLCL